MRLSSLQHNDTPKGRGIVLATVRYRRARLYFFMQEIFLKVRNLKLRCGIQKGTKMILVKILMGLSNQNDQETLPE